MGPPPSRERPLAREGGRSAPGEEVASAPGDLLGPVRTCIGCRGKAAARSLLRVVVRDGVLVPDPERRLPGRGAHIHPDARCAETATRRRAWARALRVAGSPDPAAVLVALTETPPTTVRETS